MKKWYAYSFILLLYGCPSSKQKSLDSSLPSSDHRHCYPKDNYEYTNGKWTTEDKWKTAIFTCNDGYFIEGSTTETYEKDGCTNGLWTNYHVRKCEAKKCDEALLKDENSYSYYSSYTNSATLTCNWGYAFHTDKGKRTETSIACKDGHWDPEPPKCENTDCPRISADPHGKWVFTKLTAELTCETGWATHGLFGQESKRASSNCSDGSWSPAPSTCFPSTSSSLDDDECLPLYSTAGTWTYSSEHGSKIGQLTCQDGYEISGFSGKMQDAITCKQGKWDAFIPRCTVRTCTPLLDPHGEWSGRFEAGSLAFLYCDSDYRLAGSVYSAATYIRCSNKGKWEKEIPICERKPAEPSSFTCAKTLTTLNGVWSYAGNTAFLFCNVGYDRNGFRADCQPDGTWRETTPSRCEPKSCNTWDYLGFWSPSRVGEKSTLTCPASTHPFCTSGPSYPNHVKIATSTCTASGHVPSCSCHGYSDSRPDATHTPSSTPKTFYQKASEAAQIQNKTSCETYFVELEKKVSTPNEANSFSRRFRYVSLILHPDRCDKDQIQTALTGLGFPGVEDICTEAYKVLSAFKTCMDL